jgi:hypothetical protein
MTKIFQKMRLPVTRHGFKYVAEAKQQSALEESCFASSQESTSVLTSESKVAWFFGLKHYAL